MPGAICYLIAPHLGFEMWGACYLALLTGTLHNRHVPFRGPENQFRVYASALCIASGCMLRDVIQLKKS